MSFIYVQNQNQNNPQSVSINNLKTAWKIDFNLTLTISKEKF